MNLLKLLLKLFDTRKRSKKRIRMNEHQIRMEIERLQRQIRQNLPPRRPPINFRQERNANNRILILSEHKQIAPIDDHIAVLPIVPTTTSTSYGDQPVQTVLYKDLNLNSVEEVFRDEERSRNFEVFPLRNFLFGKKKGFDNGKGVFSAFASLNKKEEIGYKIRFDMNLLIKMCKTLGNSKLTVQLRIESVEGSPSGNQKRLKLAIFESSEALTGKVSEMLGFGEILLFTIGDLYSSRPGYDKLIRRKLVQLSAQANENLVFIWTVGVLVDAAPVYLHAELNINSDSVLQGLYGLEDSKDLTILASNKAEIKCHRNILIVQSEVFNSMLCLKNGMVEAQTGRIEMLENSSDGLNQFVRFLYGFPIPKESLGPEMAVELLQLSNKYGIKKMEEVLQDFLTSKSMSWFTVDAVIELYFAVRNVQSMEELRAHALTEMSGLTQETLNSCDYFKKLPQEDAFSLLFTLLEWK